MAEPTPNFGQKQPLTLEQQKAAKVAAVKETMAGVTKAKAAEAEAAAKVPEQLKQAYATAGGTAKLTTQAGLAGQLAQQEVGGAGYNKAAARQTAADMALQTAEMQNKINIGGTQAIAQAQEQALEKASDLAGQKYEQLTAEQKLDKETEEMKSSKNADLKNQEDAVLKKNSSGWGDDEEGAVAGLMQQYEEQKQYYDSDPAAKQRLAETIAGIRKNAGYGWDGANVAAFIGTTMGYGGTWKNINKSPSDWDVTEVDF